MDERCGRLTSNHIHESADVKVLMKLSYKRHTCMCHSTAMRAFNSVVDDTFL